MLRRLCLVLAIGALLAPLATVNPAVAADATPGISIAKIGTADSGSGEGGSEISAFDPVSSRLFVTNGEEDRVDVFDLSDPTEPVAETPIPIAGDGINSVAVRDGLIAIATETDPTDAVPGTPVTPNKGQIEFHTITAGGVVVASDVVTAGFLPDMVTFSPDGTKVVVANEGEPLCATDAGGDENEDIDLAVDPIGSVSIIDVADVGGGATANDLDFTSFDSSTNTLVAAGVRVFFGAGTSNPSSLSEDLEPEYVAVAPDSMTAYVFMQENNAVAVVDLIDEEIDAIVALGTKDHSLAQNALDPSNRDDEIAIGPWPTHGMFQPDSAAAFAAGGSTYLATANEGDARDYDCWSEEVRVGDLTLDATTFPEAASLQMNENLGRLKTTTATGDTDADGDIDEIHSYGARSFSLWDAAGNLVWDSGNDFAQFMATNYSDFFQGQLDVDDIQGDAGDETFWATENRSDDKAGEPEALTIGTLGDRIYAFVGLERFNGFFIYDVTDPTKPFQVTFVDTITDRSQIVDGEDFGAFGDVSPEGMTFVTAADSPNGKPLLMVAFELSGTTAIYEIGTCYNASAGSFQTGFKVPCFDTPTDSGFGDVSGAVSDAVDFLKTNGITEGISDSNYGPVDTATRGQAVAMLYRFAGAPTGASVSGFTDVTKDWQIGPVNWAKANGITTGTTATTFSPERSITRAEFLVMLWRAAGMPTGAPASGFADVTKDWQTGAVDWAKSIGLTTGTSDTTFSPDRPITRGELALFIERYARLINA